MPVIDTAVDGKSIAKVDDRVIFVHKTIPGDVVDIQVLRKKKGFYEGQPVYFHKYSDKRTNPVCAHFGVCGGCKWQSMQYEEQLKFKQKHVTDAFQRIAKTSTQQVLPIIPSDNTFFYRNKLEFTFSNLRWFTKEELELDDPNKNPNGLGFHIPRMFDKVVDINKCYLQKDPSNAIRNTIREFALQHGMQFYNIRTKEGYLRNLIIRTSTTNEIMVIVVFYYDDPVSRKKLLKHVAKTFPEVTSVMYVVNPKPNDSIYDLDARLFCGNDHIIEKMDNLKFKIGAKSFYQTNSEQARRLYQVIKQFAEIQKHELVYDLYTGTGTIANFIASEAKQVVGIESVPEAVQDAIENSKLNNITNTRFTTGDMKDVLDTSFFKQYGLPDVIILDPPRAGVHKNVIKAIEQAAPSRIIYVSCNPATQARDIGMLSEAYKPTKVQPVDMFPHTHHVENVALLVR